MRISSVNSNFISRKSTFGMAQMTPEIEAQIKSGIEKCQERKDEQKLQQIGKDLKWIAENDKNSIIYIDNGVFSPLDSMWGNSYYIRPRGLKGIIFGPKHKIAETNILDVDNSKLPRQLRIGMEILHEKDN